MASAKKMSRKKEMIITLKSKPLSDDSAKAEQLSLRSEVKPRQKQRKGTRGPSWIG